MIIEINTIDKTIIVKSEFQLHELTDVVQTYHLWDYKIIMDKKSDYIFHPIDPIPNVNPWKPQDVFYNDGSGDRNPIPPFFTTSLTVNGNINHTNTFAKLDESKTYPESDKKTTTNYKK